MALKAIMRRLVNGQNLSTDVVEGTALYRPVVGRPFMMTTAPIVDLNVNYRMVHTSNVKEIDRRGPDSYVIETKNSHYSVEITEE